MVNIHGLDMSVTRMLLANSTCTSVIWIIVQRIGLLLRMEPRENGHHRCPSAQSRTDGGIHKECRVPSVSHDTVGEKASKDQMMMFIPRLQPLTDDSRGDKPNSEEVLISKLAKEPHSAASEEELSSDIFLNKKESEESPNLLQSFPEESKRPRKITPCRDCHVLAKTYSGIGSASYQSEINSIADKASELNADLVGKRSICLVRNFQKRNFETEEEEIRT